MKTLYLIRHGKSSWANQSLQDFDRPLNHRGERDVPFMGKRLREYDTPDLILSSSANRAISTARIIAGKVGYAEARILEDETMYLASEKTLLSIIREIDNQYKTVMLFGHNPGFTMLANDLTNYFVENIPTCGVFCITFNIERWQQVGLGNGTVAFFDYPKLHAKD